jgi:hypothetical protein
LHNLAGVSKRGHGTSKFYWDNDIKRALDLMKTLSGEKLEEWKRKATLRTESRDEVGN